MAVDLMIMEHEIGNKIARLLIYIPCYVDYRLAITQAQRATDFYRNHCSSTPDPLFKLEIMISTNGVEFTNEELLRLQAACDHLVVHDFGISGDINITQGFMHAMRLGVDFFWILSSNDEISDSSISLISKELVSDSDVDLLVGANSNLITTREVTSTFLPENADLPFGLISCVVYRTSRMKSNFDTAVQLNWTGWGQLATIESSCISLGGIKVKSVPAILLCRRSERGAKDSYMENERIRNGYAHSFFGMPTIIGILYSRNHQIRKKLLNGWVRKNWHLVNYFSNARFVLWEKHFASNQQWLKEYGYFSIKGASIQYRLLFKLSRIVKIESFRNSPSAQKLLRISKG
jgi:hypothetical protein